MKMWIGRQEVIRHRFNISIQPFVTYVPLDINEGTEKSPRGVETIYGGGVGAAHTSTYTGLISQLTFFQ